jgi:two-component system phosphate regulon response regulator OmpR
MKKGVGLKTKQQSNSQTNILVVDDVAKTREILRRYLGREGYEVTLASNVNEAINILNSYPSFDLVVTDIKMEHSSGLELARYIQNELPWVAVLIVTGYPTVEMSETLDSNECIHNVLTKPFTQKELLEKVRKIFKSCSEKYADKAHTKSNAMQFERNV